MQLLPQYTLQLQNAGWFSLIYGLLSITILISLSKARRKRILTFPKFTNKSEKIFTGLALFIFGRGLIAACLNKIKFEDVKEGVYAIRCYQDQ